MDYWIIPVRIIRESHVNAQFIKRNIVGSGRGEYNGVIRIQGFFTVNYDADNFAEKHNWSVRDRVFAYPEEDCNVPSDRIQAVAVDRVLPHRRLNPILCVRIIHIEIVARNRREHGSGDQAKGQDRGDEQSYEFFGFHGKFFLSFGSPEKLWFPAPLTDERKAVISRRAALAAGDASFRMSRRTLYAHIGVFRPADL
jgi:hypothetical protein